MSRPTKITPEIQNKIVAAVRGGNYMETAAIYAGINKSTLYDWMKRGRAEKDRLDNNPKAKLRKAEEPFVEFSDALEDALMDSEMTTLARITSSKDWKAHAWRLERRFPERWGRSDKLQLENNVSGEVNMNVKTDVFANIDEYAELFRKAADRQPTSDDV